MKGKNLFLSYKLSERAVVLLADIAEQSGKISEARLPASKSPNISALSAFLRLSAPDKGVTDEQVEAVIQKKTAHLESQTVQWVRNGAGLMAIEGKLRPYEPEDLLQAHRILWGKIAANAGTFRTENLPRPEGKKRADMAPVAKRVPDCVQALLEWGKWGKKTPAHPLIQAAVMGYALEVIQPFSVGNRSISLFWQLLLLNRWRPVFWSYSFFPIAESRLAAYEEALESSIRNENAGKFIEWMLECYNETLKESPLQKPKGGSDEPMNRLLQVLGDESLSTRELMERLDLKHRPSFRDHYLLPALHAGWIEMTIPDKPNSCRQKYRRCAKSS